MPFIPENHPSAPSDTEIRLYGDRDLLSDLPGDFPRLDETALRREFGASGGDGDGVASRPKILVAAMPADGAAAWLDGFTAFCADLRCSAPRHHLILRHGGISPVDLSRLYRAGLDDAVDLAEGTDALEAAIETGRRAIAEFRDRAELLKEQQLAGDKLRASQADLRRRVETTAAELATANRSLELANHQLTRHMKQLSLLYSFGRELSAARNWDKTLEKLLKNLADFVRARGAALVLRPTDDAPYTPRKTYQWRESSWETILRNIDENRPRPGIQAGRDLDIFHFKSANGGSGGRITALPLNHRGLCLGYLLLLDLPEHDDGIEFLPLLNALQLIIADEVAAAQMMDRMRELSVFNSRVLETVYSGIWVIDEFARTIYCNRVGREMLSAKPSEPRIVEQPNDGVGRGRGPDGKGSMSEFFRRDAFSDGPGLEIFLDGLLKLSGTDGVPLRVLSETGAEGFLGEGHLHRADGSWMPVLIQSSHMHGRGQDESWLVVVLEDQREAKRLAAEKLRADKLQSMVEMSSTLAHEIRNPLMGLSAQAELLSETLPPDDSRGRYIDVITREVERIDRTITGMLDFTRPCRPRIEPVDLRRLLSDSAKLVAPRAEAAGVDLDVDTTDLDATHPPLDGDQIQQVLLNLLCNAIDASPRDGTVRLSAGTGKILSIEDPETGLIRNREGTLIEVRDTGPGFPDADREAIFRPFFTTKTAGTGLGLPVSRKIVEAHAGALDAVCRDGQTLFRIQLPTRSSDDRYPSAEETS